LGRVDVAHFVHDAAQGFLLLLLFGRRALRGRRVAFRGVLILGSRVGFVDVARRPVGDKPGEGYVGGRLVGSFNGQALVAAPDVDAVPAAVAPPQERSAV
jgi:hypothetical protein